MARKLPYTLSIRARPTYPARSLLNLLRMGHCAPTVMQTMLQLSDREQEWLVKLTAGLPGGIGNTQGECGGITSPLIVLGLRHGLVDMRAGLPVLFDLGHAYCQRFQAKNGALFCKEIQGKGCAQAVCHAPGLLAETQADDGQANIPGVQRCVYARLYAHFQDQEFHCAQAVFQHLSSVFPVTNDICRAVSAFIGGTLFQGWTCSAFAAGVMAIGLQTGQIENSYTRVLSMLIRGMDISDENANRFHRTSTPGSAWQPGLWASLVTCHAGPSPGAILLLLMAWSNTSPAMAWPPAVRSLAQRKRGCKPSWPRWIQRVMFHEKVVENTHVRKQEIR